MFQPKITSYEDERLQKEPIKNLNNDGEVMKGVIGPEAIHHAQPNIATFATEAYFPFLITPCQTNLAMAANRGRELDNLVIYMIHQAIWSGRKRWLERDRKERHLVSTCAGHPKVTNKAINTTLQKTFDKTREQQC